MHTFGLSRDRVRIFPPPPSPALPYAVRVIRRGAAIVLIFFHMISVGVEGKWGFRVIFLDDVTPNLILNRVFHNITSFSRERSFL